MVQEAELAGALRDLQKLSRGSVYRGYFSFVWATSLQTNVVALISEGINAPHAIWDINMSD